ncbi:hypothetical protein E2562_008190 [Oryza meyeriana var. granulata]|uniref:Transmembrane protein n=1 Tax=Oryza meyeriana var. granulata TaxID=110450 RepID=A0A6G1CEZ1_9ORYZ|nr:hypothetical protein E2562_008190 [Oryza meyeriana var. granulata]
MHRSSSYYLSSTASSSSSSLAAMVGPSGTAAGVVMDVDQLLPTYDPQSDAGKKEALDASLTNLAHTLVHLVPVVVLLCGLLLWSFSTTASPSEVGGTMENTVHAKLVPLAKSRSTHNLNRSETMTGMDGVDPMSKNEVVKKPKRRNLRRER